MKLVFLLEEESMKALLDELLPEILPDGVDFQTVKHKGKQDLRRSIPKKLRGWNEPGDIRFVILHDQDNVDCIELKKSLLELCSDRRFPVLVRIACQELDAWYFGDTHALAAAYNKPSLALLSQKKKFREPDHIADPKAELKKLLPDHQQISGAKRIAPHMQIEENTSESFQQFVSGIRQLARAE